MIYDRTLSLDQAKAFIEKTKSDEAFSVNKQPA